MMQFLAFALYLCFSAALLIAVPVMLHPTLSASRKLLLCGILFLVFVPGGLTLYALVGAPPMAFEP